MSGDVRQMALDMIDRLIHDRDRAMAERDEARQENERLTALLETTTKSADIALNMTHGGQATGNASRCRTRR